MMRADEIVSRIRHNIRHNPRDWRIDDLKMLARRNGIDWRQPGTSHVTFSYPGLLPVTVPAHKPIKPIYIKLFLESIHSMEEHDGE